MTSPPAGSFLDFFVLEASEYVEQIDGLLLRAAAAGPDSDSLQRIARALRGSATMAKLPSFAELASGVEAVGRALKEGVLAWDEGIKGSLTAAVDDLKILVRAARSWSPAEDQWALNRLAELSQFVQPVIPGPTAVPVPDPNFIGTETNNIAAGLELLATRPDDRNGALNVLRRVRALRGVAGMREIPALPEVSEAAEAALRPIELGDPSLSPERVNLLRVAGELLRTIAAGLATGEVITSATPQYNSFLSALDAMLADVAGSDRVIPIANLFYNDAGPHVISAAPHPPTTPAQRFRMEVVSLGEHLHKVIGDARVATDEIQREHARGELARALRAIRATAASFGQMAVAQTVEAYLERTGDLNVAALDAIANFATTISPAAVAPTPAAQRAVSSRVTQPGPAAISADDATGHARRAEVSKPPVRSLRSMALSLDDTIAAFENLANERMAEPAALDDDVVPVDALVYRGRAALDRAVELRDAIRRAGTPPSPEELEELYDLVELARID